uniref:Uncharacterized protein n=1 Tax=Arundo donax TaxID=35708 RepID=A0A0A9EG00_ARUDO
MSIVSDSSLGWRILKQNQKNGQLGSLNEGNNLFSNTSSFSICILNVFS